MNEFEELIDAYKNSAPELEDIEMCQKCAWSIAGSEKEMTVAVNFMIGYIISKRKSKVV